jgi:hypothetical protein
MSQWRDAPMASETNARGVGKIAASRGPHDRCQPHVRRFGARLGSARATRPTNWWPDMRSRNARGSPESESPRCSAREGSTTASDSTCFAFIGEYAEVAVHLGEIAGPTGDAFQLAGGYRGPIHSGCVMRARGPALMERTVRHDLPPEQCADADHTPMARPS